jgi:hypothetical protein
MDSIDVEEESVLTAIFKDAFPGNKFETNMSIVYHCKIMIMTILLQMYTGIY